MRDSDIKRNGVYYAVTRDYDVIEVRAMNPASFPDDGWYCCECGGNGDVRSYHGHDLFDSRADALAAAIKRCETYIAQARHSLDTATIAAGLLRNELEQVQA